MSMPENTLVRPGTAVRLAEFDPRNQLGFADKETAKVEAVADAREIDRLQDILFAEGRRALLVILQGTDTSGKDGTIRDVFNATGPLGVQVTAFGPPARRSFGMIICGVCIAPARLAARSASSTARTTRTSWL
jgi:polyphosphate kinase 2 (PPK2 family)